MSAGHGEKKSRNKEKAIMALLSEPTIKQAAQMAGIGEATLWRWLQDPEFDEQYRSARKQALSQAVSRLQQSTGKAVDTLNEIMEDNTAPPPSRVTASKTILEMAFKANEQEIENRIAEIERMLKESGQMKGVR